MEAGRNIHTPFNQAVSADMFNDHVSTNMTGKFAYIVPEHSTAYLYSVSDEATVIIIDEDEKNTFNIPKNYKFCFPIRLMQGTQLIIETNENTLTQLLIIDGY